MSGRTVSTAGTVLVSCAHEWVTGRRRNPERIGMIQGPRCGYAEGTLTKLAECGRRIQCGSERPAQSEDIDE